ncbi:hypothetical protein EWM64_g3849 [Hericium alpestre]|uniref:Uncharacterized protein n=1 Tax=Hericium alpestre TaxID=135208 RepID=A0A4Z0A1V6_9AGAM|nr:hypothetical protein EWM64_g3849 [Hericium alpestre]
MLPDGAHSVAVNVMTSGPTFYFDNVVYDPSPSVSLSDMVVLVDNNDTGIGLSGSGWMILKFIGELNGNQTTGTYAIDGASPTSFVVPGHGRLGEFNQVYFTTPDFDPGPHTLLVMYQGNANTALLVLNYFYVTNETQTLQASASPTLGGPDMPTSSIAADSRSGSSTPIGAIVGGVLGGLALLIGALLVFILC